MVEPAVVAQADRAPAVDLVVPDPVVGGDDRAGGDGFRSGGVGLGGGAPVQGAVGSLAVVVGGELVELALQDGGAGGAGPGGEPLLLGLVEPFDAPMLSSGLEEGLDPG